MQACRSRLSARSIFPPPPHRTEHRAWSGGTEQSRADCTIPWRPCEGQSGVITVHAHEVVCAWVYRRYRRSPTTATISYMSERRWTLDLTHFASCISSTAGLCPWRIHAFFLPGPPHATLYRCHCRLYHVPSSSSSPPLAPQGVYVTILSVANCFGRLFAGYASDHWQNYVSRPAMVTIGVTLMGVAHFVMMVCAGYQGANPSPQPPPPPPPHASSGKATVFTRSRPVGHAGCVSWEW